MLFIELSRKTVDVRKFADMLGNLESSFNLPGYLFHILRGYLGVRSLPYGTLRARVKIRSKVVQEPTPGRTSLILLTIIC